MNGRVISNREGVSGMMMQEALPGIKRFLKPVGLKERMRGLTVRFLAAFILHWGRMSAVQAAMSVSTEPRHRAQSCRFLGRKYWRKLRLLSVLQEQMLQMESKQGRFVFIVDQTLSSQQGDKTENTYSTGNRQRRPRKGRRYGKYQHKRQALPLLCDRAVADTQRPAGAFSPELLHQRVLRPEGPRVS
jgi:DDE superfamily endonuclease